MPHRINRDLFRWRVRAFARLMSAVLVLALVVAVPSALVAAYRGYAQVALMDTIALAWILAIWRFDRWSHTTRVVNFLAMLFFVAVGSIVSVGAVGLCYLLAIPVIAVILLGQRAAYATIGAGALAMIVLGLAGYSELTMGDLANDSPVGVMLFALNYACVGALGTLTAGSVLKGLSRSLNKADAVSTSLEQERTTLRAVNQERRLTSAALAGLHDMVLIIQAIPGKTSHQPIIFANASFERHSGYRIDEIIGQSLHALHGPETSTETVAALSDAMARYEPASAQLVNYTKAGEPRWVEVDIVPFAGEGGPITHWVAVGRDITEKRQSAESIRKLAFYDVLTELPNRRLLMERLGALTDKAQRGEGIGAVLYLDLDNFKSVNDARGHATGDALLKHVAGILRDTVHRRDTVARLGGDEFVVLAEHLGDDASAATAAAVALAERVGTALRRPIDIDGQVYQSSGSVGISLPTRPEQTAQDLLREADTAMYHAKAAGRNSAALFETTMLAAAENTLMLERDLGNALDNDEFALHLQLQVSPDGQPIGAESLLRWRRADGVLVPPDVFIPIAEKTGLIVPLGTWVLRQACLSWLRLSRAGHALPLSVNVSPRQFQQADFVDVVRSILAETGVPATQLIFELTEGLLVENMDATVARMHVLAELGIRFSIDDFGTGYSSLAYLQKMPLYELKIDKGFMRDMPHDVNGTALVKSILAMAGQLGLRVVAEGIETREQAQFLASHGKPCMQGFLFCRPMPLGELISQLEAAA